MNKTLLMLLLLSGCITEQQEHKVNSGSIIHGTLVPSDDEATTFTVGILSSKGNCTGVVIGKRTILTAAHCLIGHTASNTRIALGNIITNSSKSLLALERLYAHPDYVQGDYSTPDLGVVILQDDLPDGMKAIPLFAGPEKINVMALEGHEYSRFTENSIDNFFDFFEQVGTVNSPNDLSLKKNSHGLHGKLFLGYADGNKISLVQHSGGLCHGDSGGPTTIRINDKRVLMGINWYVIGKNKCSEVGTITPIQNHLEWIEKVAKEFGNDQISQTILEESDSINSKDDAICLVASYKVFEALAKSTIDFCADKDNLEQVISENLKMSVKSCTSPLARYYPAFIQNTLNKLKNKCDKH